MIRTLVVDDSPTARRLIAGILRMDRDFEIVAEAGDGQEAVRLARELRPDLVTMDIQMPRMDGFQATQTIMAQSPCPIVVISNLDLDEVKTSLDALRAGALMVLQKPAGPASPDFPRMSRQILASAKAMAHVRTLARTPAPAPRARPLPERVRQSLRAPAARPALFALAASTGGPRALQHILRALPADFPAPIVVVQHIAEGFVGGLATWLGEGASLRVKVAEAGEPLLNGTVYVAPDGHHLEVTEDGRVRLSDAPPIGAFRPSANALFASVARAYGERAVGVILTGIGSDGVDGLRALRAQNGFVVAQDEASSVLFGMPQAAIEAGLPDVVLGLDDIPGLLLSTLHNGGSHNGGSHNGGQS